MARGHGYLAIALIALQLALQSAFFPWAALGSADRLNNIDDPFHVYQVHLAAELCEEGLYIGYDPRFGAGHVGGVTFNASAKVPGLLACAGAGGGDAALVYKQVVFWSGVVAPALIVLACAMAGLPSATAAVAGVLGLLLWWTGPIRWYYTAGLTSFVAAAYLAPAFVVAFIKAAFASPPRTLPILTVAAVAAAGFLLHPLFSVAAALLGLGWLVMEWPGARHKGIAALAVLACLVVMVGANWAWLQPSLAGQSFATMLNPYQRVVDPLLFLREMAGVAPSAAGGSRLYPTLLIGALACALLYRGPARRALLGLSVGAITVMAWASVGALSNAVAQTQPNRFSILAWLVLAIPAAAGLCTLAGQVWRGSGSKRFAWAGLGLLAMAPALYFVREAYREALAPAGVARYGVQPPAVRGAGPLEKAMAKFLDERTDPSARVLFENSLGRIHDGGHVAGMLAWNSARSFIGGPYLFTLEANAWDNYLFGRETRTWLPADLSTTLDAYNVRWMLCHSTNCKVAMSALEGVREVAQFGPVLAFERRESPGYFAQGIGRVVAQCGNRVEFADVSGDQIVLRFRWVEGLRAVPAGRVLPQSEYPGGPQWVAVKSPPAAFALRMGEGDGVPCSQRKLKAP